MHACYITHAIHQATNLPVGVWKQSAGILFWHTSMCICLMHAHVYLCICLPLFCFCVGSFSARFELLSFSLSAVKWVWQYGFLCLLLLVWQMCFCLAKRELAVQMSVLPSFSIWAHQEAKGHRGKISAPPSRWQQESCINDYRAAVRSFRIWQRGSSTPSHSLLLPNRCSGDGGAYTDGSVPVIQTSMIFVHWV